jgi:hypothetical protein
VPLYGLSLGVFQALLVVGAYGAAAGWGAGAYLLVVAFLQLLAVHLAVGVVGYRRAMHGGRWPLVLPLDDDEDW